MKPNPQINQQGQPGAGNDGWRNAIAAGANAINPAQANAQPAPQMGQPLMGMGGANFINALKPQGPTTMPPPGGNNFFSQRLAQTGQNPAISPVAIRRPMPDQPMQRPPMSLPNLPNQNSSFTPPPGFSSFRSRIRT